MKIERWFLVAVALTATACVTSLRDNFYENVEKQPWARENRAVAEDLGYRLLFGKMVQEGKFEIMYSRLPKDRVVAQSKKYVDNLKDVLDRRNKVLDKYNESFDLRPYWETQEVIFKAIYGRALADMLNDVFEQAVGERAWSYGSRDEFGFDHRDGYDPSVYTVTDLGKKFPFESKLINEAKAGGVLELIETSMVERFRRYDHKEPEPNAPDDPNRFVWRDKKYSLKVAKYKIVVPGETPKDSFTNYIEVTRVVNGKEESKPCIKAFLNGGFSALVVIDIDQEADKLGFGLPDSVERMPESALVDQATINRLYPDSEAYKRQEPKRPPIRAEIAPVGTEIDMWTACAAPLCDPSKGWRVPFTYKNDDEDSYTVDLKFAKGKHGDKDDHSSKLKQVEYIQKHWSVGNGAGSVVESFKPKPPFDQKVVSASSSRSTRLEFVMEDGSERSGVVTPKSNQFVVDKPEVIAFTLGEKHYEIKDADGNGVYEKRREVAEDSSSRSRSYGPISFEESYSSDADTGLSPAIKKEQ